MEGLNIISVVLNSSYSQTVCKVRIKKLITHHWKWHRGWDILIAWSRIWYKRPVKYLHRRKSDRKRTFSVSFSERSKRLNIWLWKSFYPRIKVLKSKTFSLSNFILGSCTNDPWNSYSRLLVFFNQWKVKKNLNI